jgi:2-hydroxy-4-carboxymuconate semialdehyde hemiacetal dehydrogenase
MEGELKIHHIVSFFGLFRRTNTTAAGKPRSWTDDLLWHFGAHMIDVVLWTTGHREAESCTWTFGPPHPTQGIMDIGLSLRLPGEELFTLAMSYNVAEFRWNLSFIGEEATLDFAIGELRDASGEIVVPQQSIVELGEQDREFIDAVRENRDPAITGEAILPTMRILQEAQDSRSRNE